MYHNEFDSNLEDLLKKMFGRGNNSGGDNRVRTPRGSFGGYLKILFIAYVAFAIFLLFQSHLILDLSLSILAILAPFVVISFLYGVYSFNKKYIMASIIAVLGYIGIQVIYSPLINYQAHRDLIGEVEEVEFSSQVKHIDLNQLPIIDEKLAYKLADKKLGEIPSLGSQVTIGKLDLQSVNGELYYVGPLEHTSFFKWFSNREGTKGYIKVSATNQSDVQLVTELNGQEVRLKYLQSAFLFSDLDRYAFFKDMKAGHTDYTFELDDEGNPYYVITRYDNAFGFTEAKAIGALIINVQTGESNIYDTDNLPLWVDRIQPQSYIRNYIDKWGVLVHGIFNFSDKDKLISTPDMNLIYNEDECYYYTGITSVGNDESLVGFTLTNTRTGKTTMYKTAGATESAAMKSAEGKVQQFGYTATFPYLINIQNEPTYFMTLKDSNGLVKQYAMVNVKNFNIVGVGDNLTTTLNKYLDGLTNTNISLEGSNSEETIEGEIERIGLVVKDGVSIYDVKINGHDGIFSISTEMSREVAMSNVGDKVKIKYIPLGNSKYIITNYFENVSYEPLQGESTKETDSNSLNNKAEIDVSENN